MKQFLHAAAFALLATPALTQSTTELAEQYVNMPEVQSMITNMFAPETLSAQMVASLPASIKLTPDQQTRIGQVMSGAMNDLRPRLEEIMISGSAETFSADELQALITFYGSEHGGAVMSKMSPFMANVMGSLAPEMQAMQAQIMPQVIEILQDTK